jgi:hypothetical protein
MCAICQLKPTLALVNLAQSLLFKGSMRYAEARNMRGSEVSLATAAVRREGEHVYAIVVWLRFWAKREAPCGAEVSTQLL